ncbi:hypothetical protein ACFLYP_02960, partial [Chloroflexota bacterium]
MSQSFIISTLHLILAVIQYLLAGVTFISNRQARANRAIAALLALFGTISFAISQLVTALTYDQAAPWMFLIAGTIYIIGPITLFVSLTTLRPKYLERSWVKIPLVFLMFAMPVCAFLDFSGTSLALIGKPLVYLPPTPSTYFGGYPESIVGEGILRPLGLFLLFGFALGQMIFPDL